MSELPHVPHVPLHASIDTLYAVFEPLPVVRRRFASALLGVRHPAAPVPEILGVIRLLPAQIEAARRVQLVIRQFGGALLADDVGSGKTFVALAVARDYEHVHVIAPATLLPMWRDAIRDGLPDGPPVQLQSLTSYSLGSHEPLPASRSTLVIIDEAHHLRNTHTARYRTIARVIAGADTLLLSATPLHNRVDDVHTLCALFLPPDAFGGASGGSNSSSRATPDDVIVRSPVNGAAADTPVDTPVDTGADRHTYATTDVRARRPSIRQHRPFRLPQDRETLEQILTLPPPLPLRDGAATGALIRLGLLRAWCSSDAAFTQTLRSRRLRSEALRDALRVGRHPSRREFRTWLVGEDYSQLGFPELLIDHRIDRSGTSAILATLEHHLQAVTALAHHHRTHAKSDAQRADVLRRILRRHPDRPVIAFSQFERTVVALHRALRDIAGIGALTGKRGHIASGPIDRHELLGLFAPRAQGRAPPAPHQVVRLLLTTDLLAEGVNLQDAGVVVHLDLPWTDALLSQRVGRCARLGSPHEHVHVYRLMPSGHVARALRMEARLLHKARLTHRHITGTPPRPSTPEALTLLRAELKTWSDGVGIGHQEASTAASAEASTKASTEASAETSDEAHPERPGTSTAVPIIAAIGRRGARPRGRGDSALVLLEPPVPNTDPAAAMMLHVVPGSAHPVARGTKVLLAAMRSLELQAMQVDLAPVVRQRIDRLIARVYRHTTAWLERQRVSASMGHHDPASRQRRTHMQTHIQTRAHRLMNQVMTSLPMPERTRWREQVTTIRRGIDGMRGAGTAAAVSAWCAQAPAFPQASPAEVQSWLVAWTADPLRGRLPANASAPVGATHWRITAMILLVNRHMD